MVKQDQLISSIVKFMQRTVPSEASNQEGPNNPGERHCNCGGHGCNCSGRVEGHSDPIGKGYPGDNQGAFKAKDRPKFRHDRSRSGM